MSTVPTIIATEEGSSSQVRLSAYCPRRVEMGSAVSDNPSDCDSSRLPDSFSLSDFANADA